MRTMLVTVVLVLVVLHGSVAAQSFKDRMDAGVGTLTTTDFVVKYGPPAFQAPDPSSGYTLMQWVETSEVISSPSRIVPGSDPFSQGLARGQAMSRQRSYVDTQKRILTIWVDEQGVMQKWAETWR